MRFFSAFLCLLLTAPVMATELWGGAVAGMSVEDVSAKFPDATRTTNPGNYSNGARNELTAPGPVLAGHRFRIDFTFLQGKLTDVRLHLDEPLSFNDAGTLIANLRQGLTAKYGAPIEWKENDRGGMQTADGSWRQEGMLVELTALGIGQNPAIVQVRYYQPDTTGAL